MGHERARAFFEREIAECTGSAAAIVEEVTRDDLAVPGFATFEAREGDARTGGWANDDGVVVLPAYINFRPIAEALGAMRGDDATAADLARKVAWSYGPTWTPIDAPPTDLGAAAPRVEPADRIERMDGTSYVVFYLRDRDPNDPTIVKFVIDGRDPADAIAETWQVWPESEV